MAKVVIVGASTGGLPAAYEMKRAIGASHQVTVISNTGDFHFIPSNPWVAVGWRKRRDISFPLRPCLEKKSISFIAEAAQSIDPRKNEVTTTAGTCLFFLPINSAPYLASAEAHERIGRKIFPEAGAFLVAVATKGSVRTN